MRNACAIPLSIIMYPLMLTKKYSCDFNSKIEKKHNQVQSQISRWIRQQETWEDTQMAVWAERKARYPFPSIMGFQKKKGKCLMLIRIKCKRRGSESQLACYSQIISCFVRHGFGTRQWQAMAENPANKIVRTSLGTHQELTLTWRHTGISFLLEMGKFQDIWKL